LIFSLRWGLVPSSGSFSFLPTIYFHTVFSSWLGLYVSWCRSWIWQETRQFIRSTETGVPSWCRRIFQFCLFRELSSAFPQGAALILFPLSVLKWKADAVFCKKWVSRKTPVIAFFLPIPERFIAFLERGSFPPLLRSAPGSVLWQQDGTRTLAHMCLPYAPWDWYPPAENARVSLYS